MRCDRREWLAWAVAAGAAARSAPEAGSTVAEGRQSAPPPRQMPASVSRIAELVVDERVEPALVFLPRRP